MTIKGVTVQLCAAWMGQTAIFHALMQSTAHEGGATPA